MSLRRTLEENVFGPFDLNEVLDEYITHKRQAPVDLHRLEVVRNGRASGLDESEASISKTHGKVRYFGTLYIEDLNWISPKGRSLIHDDMQRRGLNLTLESIYGPDRPGGGLTVKIGITLSAVHGKSGSKYIGLTYLTDTKIPGEMLLFSLTTGMSTRRLRIVSLSPTCWIKSQDYIAAYRFWRFVLDICTGISKPTPENFLNAYIDHQTKAGMRVCKGTVVEMMLKHAAWLAEAAKRHVNVQSWKDFARTGILDIDEELDAEMDEREITSHLLRPTPSTLATRSISPKRKRLRSIGSQSSLEYVSNDQPLDYESDRESSPERSPSPPLTDPYVAARIPSAFRYTPRVPDNFHWWCDVEGCHYNVDLLNLTRDDLTMLDGETAAKLRLQDWSLSDLWVRLAFKEMVEEHRVEHLKSWGLRCLKGPSGVCRSRPPPSRGPSLMIFNL
ncbi:hypothetical protein BJ322DRAFT_1052869 [Thelephora terrestris]|uniref:Uncharacterized protein n=1 Tax=Thelephora terrestris TaxID=56493 RepID=A0A9P6HIJ5_9AGAM|nr:hypothetical protein BJ322DRAFT_1052869 [Thelephora terrestris]